MQTNPPRFSKAVLELVLPADMRDEVVGDLVEEFHVVRGRHDEASARRWFRKHALVTAVRFLGVRSRTAISGVVTHSVSLAHDGWHASRGLARAPGFAVPVVVMLALGVGANQTMVRLLDRVVLSPPTGISEPDRVVRFFFRTRQEGGRVDHAPSTGYPTLNDVASLPSLDGVAAYVPEAPIVGSGESAARISAEWVTASYFDVLGTQPALGRFFAREDDRVGAPPTAVISWEYWRGRFAGAPDVLGRSLRVGRLDYTIIGVANRGFAGPTLARVDLWVPLHVAAGVEAGEGWQDARGWRWIQLVARLGPGVSRGRAQADASTTAVSTDDLQSSDTPVLVSLRPADEPVSPPWASAGLWLSGLSALLWLTAVTNVASYFLAREVRRSHLNALRMALGAPRWRVVRFVLVEALVLAIPGAAVGVVISALAIGHVGPMLLPGTSFDALSSPGHVLASVLVTVMLTALFAGWPPAVRATRADVRNTLAKRGRYRSSHVRDALVITQVGGCVLLLAVASLLVSSLRTVTSLEQLGFNPDPLVAARLSGAGADEIGSDMPARLESALGPPGTAEVVASTSVPFFPSRGVNIALEDGRPAPSAPVPSLGPDQVAVSAGFLTTLGIEVIRGRSFLPGDDRPEAERVVVLSASLAAHLWPRERALDRCIHVDWAEECARVVGLVSDVRWHGPNAPTPFMLYRPLAQVGMVPEYAVAKEAPGARLSVEQVRTAILQVAPNLRFVDTRRASSTLAAQAAPWRLAASLATAFGGVALAVACFGLYSLLSFRVNTHTHELAVRRALGAPPAAAARGVLSYGLRRTLVGLVVGGGGVWVLSAWIDPMLFAGLDMDVRIFLGVALAAAVATTISSALPAIHASRVEAWRAVARDDVVN